MLQSGSGKEVGRERRNQRRARSDEVGVAVNTKGPSGWSSRELRGA
jgi:hypothetical protein